GEKMAKSAGNFVTINELLKTSKFGNHPWEGETLRLAMLKTHYRQPIDWTVSRLSVVDEEFTQWMNCINKIPASLAENKASPEVIESLCDDLNTPEVFFHLSKIA